MLKHALLLYRGREFKDYNMYLNSMQNKTISHIIPKNSNLKMTGGLLDRNVISVIIEMRTIVRIN